MRYVYIKFHKKEGMSESYAYLCSEKLLAEMCCGDYVIVESSSSKYAVGKYVGEAFLENTQLATKRVLALTYMWEERT